MEQIEIFIKKPDKKYSKGIYNLVEQSKVLDLNSEYLYLLQSTHFKNTCSIAVFNEKVVGFVSAYKIPTNPNKLFIWQVAVDEELRGQGLANKLIKHILKRKENLDLEYIHTTVSPSNKSSLRAFEKLAKELKIKMISKNFLEKEDFVNQHEEEVLYEIGPFKLKEKENK